MTTIHATVLTDVPDLTDADAIHKLTMGLYASADLPGEAGARRAGANILWRRQGTDVLVTADLPATDLPDGAQTYRVHTDFEEGDEVTFVATFDAVARVRGRDHRVTDLDSWFLRHQKGALTDIVLEHEGHFDARRRGGRLRQVVYGGSAVVADADALRELVRTGLGRSKAFGCGMVEII